MARIAYPSDLTNAQWDVSLRGCVRSLLPRREPMKHQVDHCDKYHRFAASGQHFIVLAHPTIPADPAEGPLHDPTPRQDRKPNDIIATFDDLQNPVSERSCPFDQFAGIAAVRPDQLQASIPPTKLAQHQLGAVAILNVAGMNNDSQNQSHRVNDNMPLATVDLLARVVTVRPPFSVVFTLWLSTIAAEGDFLRPADTRTLSRRAS